MPIVPTYERQSRAEMAPVNQVDIRVPQTGAGEALAQVGGNYLQAFGEEKQKQDLAFAQNAMLQFQTQADDLLNNPQTGLITKQGANAIGQSEQVIEQLGGLADQAFSSIPDGPVKEQFRNQFQAAGQPLANRARQYEVGQRQQFEVNQQTGMLSNLQRQGSDNYDDQEIIGSSLNLGGQQIVSYGQAHGQSPEEIEANWNDFREGLGRGVLKARVASGKFQQYLDRNGEPSDLGGVSRFSAHGNSSAARGLRNNNPGNIEASDKNPWEGQSGSDGRFAKFETPEHGIRALGKNLLAYQAKGFDTVAEIVNRWAPASDGNNTDAYIKALCGALGVGANDQVDMSNPRTLAALCAGIVKHENGSQPYTDEQIDSGVSAALGLSALPGTKRRTGDIAFDSASPAAQAAYISQLQSIQNEQRALYAQQLGTSLKDAYSALDEGLQPAQMPTQADLINAYGPAKGMRQWQDLQDQQSYGGVIGAAKSMSPAARQDLLERLRPTDPNASNFAANQQRWDKMQAKFKQLDAEWEKNQGSARFSSSLQNNFPLDPNDKNNQAAADHYFDQKVAPGFNINNADSLNQVAEITTKSGMLPTQIKTMLTAGATSRDPAVVVPMAKMYGQIFDNNPAAATGVDKGAMAFYSKVYAYDRAGVPAEKAVDMAYNQVYQQDDRLKQMISQQVRDKDYIKNRAKAAQDNIDNMSPNWQGIGAPTLTDPGKANQLYQRDYLAIYDANFAQTGGDADQAKAMTNAMIGKVWAVSTINGQQEIMKYAPEAVYGVTNGSGNWIKGQWEEEKKALKSSAFGGARDDTDLVLVPDAVTPRDQSYSVMVRQKNAEGYDDVRPYYGENGMPLRFRPEQKTSPMYKQTMDIQQQRVDAARAARQEEKQPTFTNQQGYTPPDFTKPFGAGIANQLPSNITAGGQ
ncbi:hypothetical protein [Serratia marcescens]|uniref:hypothetical protein n=1 Tax=Serratia marcescens TaxID=615 RepID=UPI000D73CE57|nr:hypothetical protein [Serratia marcescens]AWQ49201.1 hypothetical protein B1A42_18390 [Serratia marcescens]